MAAIFLSQAVYAAEENENPFISCEGSSKDAVLSISNKEMKKWAQVVCSKYGHIVVPADGYLWSFYGGFAPIVLTAQKFQKDQQPKEVGHSVYFTKIDAIELKEQEAIEISEQSTFGDIYPSGQQPKVFMLSTLSNTNNDQKIYFLLQQNRLSGAMPYPEWMENITERKLMPFFIYDAKKAQSNKAN